MSFISHLKCDVLNNTTTHQMQYSNGADWVNSEMQFRISILADCLLLSLLFLLYDCPSNDSNVSPLDNRKRNSSHARHHADR